MQISDLLASAIGAMIFIQLGILCYTEAESTGCLPLQKHWNDLSGLPCANFLIRYEYWAFEGLKFKTL